MDPKAPVQDCFEKYFDEQYQRHYYYNPFTKESLWEIPKDAKIIDRTSPIDSPNKNDEVKKYQDHLAKVEAAQKENLESLYPEFYDKAETGGQNDSEHAQEQFEQKVDIFREERELKVHEQMQKPARRQVNESKKDAAYVEGNYDYNIWYDKYLTDRSVKVERAPSLYRCQPEIDTGYTKADKLEKRDGTYFCVYFARGACTEGVNCRYYHRVPQEHDLQLADQDNLRDVFGRARHATHKDDTSGIGSFNKECRTLLISRIKLDPDADSKGGQALAQQQMSIKDIIRVVYEHFSPWGEVDDIHFNSGRFQAFIKYRHRFYAEFAREAMTDQVLVEGVTDPIKIQWALDSPFDKTEAQKAEQEIQQAKEMQLSQRRNTTKGKEIKSKDPHGHISIENRAQMRPEVLVPQMADRRSLLAKRQRELAAEQHAPHVSDGFDQNLFKSKRQKTDASQVVNESVARLQSVFAKIEEYNK